MKKVLLGIVVLALIIVGGCGGIFVILGGPQSLMKRKHFDRLVKEGDHAALLKAAIQEMENAKTNVLYSNSSAGKPSLTNLSPVIHKMNPGYVSLSPYHMTMEFHGGFDHFGFQIRNYQTNYVLTWYSENGGHRELLTKTVE